MVSMARLMGDVTGFLTQWHMLFQCFSAVVLCDENFNWFASECLHTFALPELNLCQLFQVA